MSSQSRSGELAVVVDALQGSTGQGPCLDAAYVHETVRVPDMATETRWPLFTTRAVEAGAAGMLACQLYVKGDDLGALNLFSRTAGALGEESVATAASRSRERLGCFSPAWAPCLLDVPPASTATTEDSSTDRH